jgi:hypothetical protein
MKIESDALRDELRALTKFSERAVPDYASDPAVQRRVGRVLANIPAYVLISSVGNTWV